MASKFQKQLVGSIILVSASVAILPSLFDGKKWYNGQNQQTIALYQLKTSQNDHATMPHSSNSYNVDLSNELPEHFSVPTNSPTESDHTTAPSTGTINPLPDTSGAISQGDNLTAIQSTPPKISTPVATSKPVVQPKPISVSAPKPVTKPVEQQPEKTVEKKPEKPKEKPVAPPQVVEKKKSTPSGKYAVQLAALSNAGRANEIVLQLQAAGYPAFTVKGTKVTRIYVGPNESQQALTQQLGKLKSLTGLDGQVVTLK